MFGLSNERNCQIPIFERFLVKISKVIALNLKVNSINSNEKTIAPSSQSFFPEQIVGCLENRKNLFVVVQITGEECRVMFKRCYYLPNYNGELADQQFSGFHEFEDLVQQLKSANEEFLSYGSEGILIHESSRVERNYE